MTVLVVGTGRCGSSFACHVLATRFGIDFGTIPPPTRATPLGSYEDETFRELNILRFVGVLAHEDWTRRMKALLERRTGPTYGFKDPCAAEFLDEILGMMDDPLVIWCDRPVSACVESRIQFVSNLDRRTMAELFARRHANLQRVLDTRPHVRLFFARRWSVNELEETIRASCPRLQHAA